MLSLQAHRAEHCNSFSIFPTLCSKKKNWPTPYIVFRCRVGCVSQALQIIYCSTAVVSGHLMTVSSHKTHNCISNTNFRKKKKNIYSHKFTSDLASRSGNYSVSLLVTVAHACTSNLGAEASLGGHQCLILIGYNLEEAENCFQPNLSTYTTLENKTTSNQSCCTS